MIGLGGARFLAGLAAFGCLAAMIWIAQTRIAPVAPDGVLLQTRVFGYDTHDLWTFALAIGRAGEVQAYRTMVLWLDSAFVLCFAAFTVLALWPNRVLAFTLAVLYAATDLMENLRLLEAVELAAGGAVDIPEPGTLSVVGYLTGQKYFLLAMIAGSILHRRLTEGKI